MNKFLKWWLFHSVCAVVLYFIIKGTGNWSSSGGAGQTAIEIAVFLSPVGAAIMWLAFRFWWWLFFSFFLGLFGKKNGPKYPGSGGKTKITKDDGILGSPIYGSKYRIDDNGQVFEDDIGGAQVGEIDKEGVWRDEKGEVVGRLDDDGILREHHEGLFGDSPKGSGGRLGEAE